MPKHVNRHVFYLHLYIFYYFSFTVKPKRMNFGPLPDTSNDANYGLMRTLTKCYDFNISIVCEIVYYEYYYFWKR